MAHHIIGQDIMRPIFKRNMTYCDTWGTFDGSFSANITLGISFWTLFFRHFSGSFLAHRRRVSHRFPRYHAWTGALWVDDFMEYHEQWVHDTKVWFLLLFGMDGILSEFPEFATPASYIVTGYTESYYPKHHCVHVTEGCSVLWYISARMLARMLAQMLDANSPTLRSTCQKDGSNDLQVLRVSWGRLVTGSVSGRGCSGTLGSRLSRARTRLKMPSSGRTPSA